MARHALRKNKSRRHLAPQGYVFAAALVMVSVIDPYSGTMASASTVQTFEAPLVEYQSLELVHSDTSDFNRVEFQILTGEHARSITVKSAPYPEPESAKGFALKQVNERGWSYDQFSCLVKLWERESNWRWNATNKSSGAYGIPQALPATKLASAGADWRTNPETQIRWGLNYIDSRYGTPCAALVHSDENNWY